MRVCVFCVTVKVNQRVEEDVFVMKKTDLCQNKNKNVKNWWALSAIYLLDLDDQRWWGHHTLPALTLDSPVLSTLTPCQHWLWTVQSCPLSHLVFPPLSLPLLSPWYDLRGWLGVKQQLSIYLSSPFALSFLFLVLISIFFYLSFLRT